MSENRSNNPDSMAVSGGFTLLPSVGDSLSGSVSQDCQTLDNKHLQRPTSQVSFLNVQEIFPLEEDFICTFTKNDDVILEGEDYVAICNHGDASESPCKVIFSVPVSDECFFQGEQKIYSVRFTAEEIPRESRLYQFCYISQNNIIGTSSPFSFGTPAESEYIAVEDPHDPGLIVFKSRVSQLNEEIGKLKDEKGDLLIKCQLNEKRVGLLRMELEKLEVALNHIHSQNRDLMETNKTLHLQLQEYQNKNVSEGFEKIPLSSILSSHFQKLIHDISEVKEVVNEIKKTAPIKEDISKIREAVEITQNKLDNSSLCLHGPQNEEKEKNVEENGQQIIEEDESDDGEEYKPNLVSFSTVTKDVREEIPETTVSSKIERDDVPACMSKLIEENDALRNELQEVKETNAFLKSRVSVLELEVRNMNEKKFQLLMDCIYEYEHDNACLKAENEKYKKDECEIESLKNQIALAMHENAVLRRHVSSSTVVPSAQDERRLSEIQNELRIALNEKEILKQQLMDLRKQTVGKISLHKNNILKSDENTQ